MVEVIDSIAATLVGYYNEFVGFFPPYFGKFLNFLALVLLIFVYAWFIWKVYRSISKKNIIELNLNKYNVYEHPLLTKIIAGVLYLLEYIIILPLLIFIVFVMFTLLLIILSQYQDVSQILFISAVIIAAIRMTSYYKETLSQDIAKMLPLTLLAITVLNPSSFMEVQYLERVLNQLAQIPEFIGQIVHYLLFIIFIEMVLRFFDFIFSLFGLEEDKSAEEKQEEIESNK